MKTALQIFFLFFISLFLTTTAAAHSVNLNSGEVVHLKQLTADLAQMQVVFVGESHDQKAHHDAQLQIIRELHAAGAEVAIGLEMFRYDGQDELDRWVAGKIDEADFAKIFAGHWNRWDLYRGIFVFARDNGIPMVGLNIPRKYVRKVARNGFNSLTDEERAKLPLATCNVSNKYRDFIRRTLDGHPLDGTAFDYFCQAQILWDASMAEQLAAYQNDNPQRTVVVLAGIGHAWRHGMPEQLERFGDFSYRVLLPEIPGRLDLNHTSADDGDYLLQGLEAGPLH
ncbi:Uncharacterized iron-regulated protein [Malonomonas rubra DSM 5091]|uniref:Uncharacterized iron-regulated protein n=1 Tax=Malonomonas rubra DSM 5091 TaxID=1122189 RepID=A0A1M6G2V3_MALRU|nr:ChaN family lipoprotein [Malonomonas rubra]SHJ04293.1 Uncharacterized iron-regulated protein [Malonomonas rubra DSM 5091]